MTFFTTIKTKIEQLKTLDPNLEAFGADTHRYQFNKPIPEADLLAFEDRFNIKLPEAYRNFLLHVGNGGAGPSYGIYPLGMMDVGWEMDLWPPDFVYPDEVFPFDGPTNDTSMLERGMPKESDFDTKEAFEEAEEQWADEHYEALQNEYWDKHALKGAIPIVHHGCCLRSWLVTAPGKEYGFIWEDGSPEESGVYPLESVRAKRYTFDSWYLEWLDRSIAQLLKA
jgi:hypothetical protein